MSRAAAVVVAATLAACAQPRVSAELQLPPQPTGTFVEREPEPTVCTPEMLAIIEGEPIWGDTFQALLALKRQKYSDRGREVPPSAERRYRATIAERLIYQELLAREVHRLELADDPVALTEKIDAGRQGVVDWANHLRRRGEDDASLEAIYLGELRERAILEQRGVLDVSEGELEVEYARLEPTFDADVDRVRVRQILVAVDSKASKARHAEAKAEAAEIEALARTPGADFAALARERSDDASARKGGDLGIFTADRMVDAFSKVAFSLPPGSIGVAKTRFGYHVILVVGHWGPGPLPFDAVRDDLRARMAASKLRTGRRDLKTELFDRYAPQNCERARLGPDPEPNR